MSNLKAPFRFDVVGSFLRPDYLKEARANVEKGVLAKEDLKTVENKAITELIAKQKEVGLNVITDGEFRRSWWHLDFMWGLNGIEKTIPQTGYKFNDEETRCESCGVVSKISGENHPFVEHFKFVKTFEDENTVARQTIPAPAQLLAELQRNTGDKPLSEVYNDEDALICDIAKAYHTVIMDLYNAGCRNVQLDDCTWGMFCDEKYWNDRNGEISLENIANQYLKVNNMSIENLPEDLAVTTHVCRGNYHSTWASAGGYEPIAQFLFANENVSAYYLEFDDERSGGFEPLRFVNGDKKVVLGLVTSKNPELENKANIISRIKEAEQYVPLDRLCLSPQCGFASTEEGNKLSENQQWDKLKLIKEIAEEVWN